MKTILSFSLAAFALCVVQTVSAQRLLWETDFPIPEGYAADVLSLSSAGDGSGGSVFAARINSTTPPFTNFVRVCWLNKRGEAIATNDLQALPFAPAVNPIVRLTPRELVLQGTDGWGVTGFTNNTLRRIKQSGGGTVTVMDTVLSPTELVVRDTKTAADKLGFFTFGGSALIGQNTNMVIRRYSNK